MRPPEIPLVKRLSPSAIQTAAEKCPEMLRFKLHFKEHKIPTTSGYSRVGGSTIHALMKISLNKYRSGAGLSSLQEMQDGYEDAWKGEIAELARKDQPIEEDPNDTEKEVFSECLDLLPVCHEHLQKLEPKLKPRPRLVEEWVNMRIPYEVGRDKDEVPVGGIVDLQLASFPIIDWKTTRFEVTGFAKKKDLQMKAYGYWAHVQHNLEEVEVSKVFFVRGPRPKDLPEIKTVGKTGKPLKKFVRPKGWPKKLPLDWKGPYCEPIGFKIKQADFDFFKMTAIRVWRMCKYGTYTPNVGVFWCQPKYCEFYAACQGTD